MTLYESLTIALAVVSAVLSLISITVVIFDLGYKLGMQKFEQYRHYGRLLASYYFKSCEAKTKGMRTNGDPSKKISAVISIKIKNCSAYPVTIDSTYVTNELYGTDVKSYHDNGFSFELMWEKANRNGKPIETTVDVCEKLVLPITLQPYEIKLLSVQIPHFEQHVKNYGDTVYPYLHFTTARKEYAIKVEIPEYHALLSAI